MTGLPAARPGLCHHGVAHEAASADLAVPDPEVVAARAAFGEAHQHPRGIRHIVVNGRFVVLEEEQADRRPAGRCAGGKR